MHVHSVPHSPSTTPHQKTHYSHSRPPSPLHPMVSPASPANCIQLRWHHTREILSGWGESPDLGGVQVPPSSVSAWLLGPFRIKGTSLSVPVTGSECLGMREVGGKKGCYSIGDVLGWSFSWLTFPLALGLVSGSLARLRVAQPTAPRASPNQCKGRAARPS